MDVAFIVDQYFDPGVTGVSFSFFLTGGHMVDIMNQRLMNRFTEQEILRIVYDVCLAVAFMHEQDPPMAHRDLKVSFSSTVSFGAVLWSFLFLSSYVRCQMSLLVIRRETWKLYSFTKASFYEMLDRSKMFCFPKMGFIRYAISDLLLLFEMICQTLLIFKRYGWFLDHVEIA